MRVTIFTGNQPRHIAAINRLASVADNVYSVQECTTLNVGGTADLFRSSDVMREYFSHVRAAEIEVFGVPAFTAPHVSSLALRMGDLNSATEAMLDHALHSDYYFVFGASWIKGWLCDYLVTRAAINIHMGIAPEYRGSSCNFWALYDGNPDLVGATLHLLTPGIDDGDVLRYAVPARRADDTPWIYGMRAAEAAIEVAADIVRVGQDAMVTPPLKQDRSRKIRYTRMADFTDAVAAEYLARLKK